MCFANERFAKTNSQPSIDPDPRALLIALRFEIVDPNLRFTVYMKTHILFPLIKNFQLYDFSSI